VNRAAILILVESGFLTPTTALSSALFSKLSWKTIFIVVDGSAIASYCMDRHCSSESISNGSLSRAMVSVVQNQHRADEWI
jgi:hypothetical protein